MLQVNASQGSFQEVFCCKDRNGCSSSKYESFTSISKFYDGCKMIIEWNAGHSLVPTVRNSWREIRRRKYHRWPDVIQDASNQLGILQLKPTFKTKKTQNKERKRGREWENTWTSEFIISGHPQGVIFGEDLWRLPLEYLIHLIGLSPVVRLPITSHTSMTSI